MTLKFAIAALVASLAWARPQPEPKFEIADVHASAITTNDFPSSAFLHAGRFEFRHATMVELVSYAWGVTDDKVVGGPDWLEMDKFDILAQAPPDTKSDAAKLMLRSLLADRFNLVVRNDTQPVPAYVLTAGKKPLLKEAAPADDDGGCKINIEGPGAGRGGQGDGGAGAPIRTMVYTCHNMTMEKFAEQLPDTGAADQFIASYPVVDQTALKGAWDFTFRHSLRGNRAGAPGADFITLFDALDKQLGLKLEPGKVPQPVLVVASVNETPAPDSPEAKKAFPDTPLEFEVADIKPSDPDVRGARLNVQPGGRVNIQGLPLKFLIEQMWNLSDEMVIGAPKFMDDDKWDIVAKAPAANADKGPTIAWDTLFGMLKTLMVERFEFKYHMEERPVSAYTLLAVKPKMKKADPASRTHCIEGPPLMSKTDARDSNPILGRLLTCQNTSMKQFADQLMDLANGYIHAPVLDSTGLEDGWDFTLSFSTTGQLRGGDAPPPKLGPGAQDLADPNGAVSLNDAIERQLGLKLELQKRPVEVMVIDHIDEKPSDN